MKVLICSNNIEHKMGFLIQKRAAFLVHAYYPCFLKAGQLLKLISYKCD